jgi:hypothetical protein
MDRANVGERAFAAATPPPHADPEAIEFVRFCYHRKRVGWPELYDEMCAVAGRGLYQGFGPEELSAIGIGFGLFQMPALAVLVSRVVAEDLDRRRRTAAAIRSSLLAGETEGSPEAAAEGVINAASSVDGGAAEPGSTDVVGPDLGVVRLAVAAGA